jgi:uncharacterized protein (DUF58 family)
VRIRPTELGTKGILLAIALEVAFLATAYSNLFFLLIVFCVVLGALGLWWNARNLAGLEVELVGAPIAAAGAPRRVSLAVRAARRRRFDVAIACDVAGTHAPLLHLSALNGTTTGEANVPGLPRGIHRVARVAVGSRFPFGLFQVTRWLPVSFELVTHPAPLEERAAAACRAGDGELAAALVNQRGTDLASLRAFRPGDAVSDLHWKATARRGTPIVKEREPAGGEAVEVVLDRRCADAAFETALSLAATVVLAAAAASRPAVLKSQGTTLALGGGNRSPDPLLRWLAGATTLPADAGAPPEAGARALRLPRVAMEAARG